MRHRRGFALIATLWFLAGVTAISLAAMTRARDAIRLAGNRSALIRAEWRAEECLARARSALADPKATARPAGGARGILARRDAILDLPIVAECPGSVTLIPRGALLDVNYASPDVITRALSAFGMPEPVADSLVSALLDWRDEDDEPRPLGAERAWYEGRGEAVPRNGVIRDVEELHLVRGWGRWMGNARASPGVEAFLAVEGGGVLLDAAPAIALAALPGVTPRLVSVLVARQRAGEASLPEMLALLSLATPEERDQLLQRFTELGREATVTGSGWILAATASGEVDDALGDRLTVRIELSLAPDGSRLAVTRRRISP